MEYKLFEYPNGKMILKDNQLWIPLDEKNSDYQAYLQWIADGNSPEVIQEEE